MAKKRGSAGAANQDSKVLTSAWGIDIDPELLILALTHRSFANEIGMIPNNERLEFLGDSVLSIVATDELYHRFPDLPESELARLRTSIVSQKPLAQVARALGLGEFVLLGVGENKTGGRDKASILSDTLEALIGATYLAHGLEPTRAVLLRHLRPVIESANDPSATADWKTPLQRYAREIGRDEILFEVEGEGPDHNRSYTAVALLDDKVVGTGKGRSKKLAENDAARVALDALRAQHTSDASEALLSPRS